MNPIKVLYAEDEPHLGRITSDVLSKNGFSVEWVQDGKKANTAFLSQDYHICLIDVMMPGLDGYSLVSEIRKRNPDIPVIFLTARSLTEDVIKGFETGGNDYIKKPFSIEELMIRMNALLKRAIVHMEKVNEPKMFHIGQYVFKHATMELIHDKKVINLTNLENELLLRLVENKNTVLQRQKVLLELWGDDTYFNARSMDVFITKLRKYLNLDDTITIVNIRGIGYKLIIRSTI